ncbi:hypothetical protein Leryth_018016 [Lithospermum erythrorhizon]|nr:hypothetical protein Leryth_018016 [Lithospermum erythrorhizon]
MLKRTHAMAGMIGSKTKAASEVARVENIAPARAVPERGIEKLGLSDNFLRPFGRFCMVGFGVAFDEGAYETEFRDEEIL